jgi:hypothetical protein
MLYRRSSKRAASKARLGINLLVAFAIGASWGFKTTAISILMPALLLLYWRVRPIQLVTLGAIFVASVVLFVQLFDVDVEAITDIQAFLLTRITVLQGDVSWYIWDLYSDGTALPNYWPTLLAALGDKVVSALFVSRLDWYEWMLYHYDWMMSYVAGVSLSQIAQGGHSIVGTPFSEGLIAGGVAGVALFAVLAGTFTGLMYRFLDRALRNDRALPAALGATYFCFSLFPWLNAGAIVQLFHISLLISGSTTLAILAVIRHRWTWGQAPQPPVPQFAPA